RRPAHLRAAHPEPRRPRPAGTAPGRAGGRGARGTVLTNARLHGDLTRYAQSPELIVLPAANPEHIAPTDFGHAGHRITQALAAARLETCGQTGGHHGHRGVRANGGRVDGPWANTIRESYGGHRPCRHPHTGREPG